jgi:hypothetical protein
MPRAKVRAASVVRAVEACAPPPEVETCSHSPMRYARETESDPWAERAMYSVIFSPLSLRVIEAP